MEEDGSQTLRNSVRAYCLALLSDAVCLDSIQCLLARDATRLAETIKYYANDAASLFNFVQIFAIFSFYFIAAFVSLSDG